MRRVVAVGALLGAAALAAGGCGGGRPAARQQLQLPHDRWSHARALFRVRCAGCHALADAGAHGRRSDLDHSAFVVAPDREGLARAAMVHGVPGMPPWQKVTQRPDFEVLVRYVAAVAGRRVPPRPPVPTTRVPRRRDRFTYARTLFDEICASCHRLADASARSGAFDMDDSPLSTSSQRPELARLVMSMGYDAGMPVFNGVLSEHEFDALVEYIGTVAGAPGAGGG